MNLLVFSFFSRHEWWRKGQLKGTDKRERKHKGNGKYTPGTNTTQGNRKGYGK
jgi:hypothetical protein